MLNPTPLLSRLRRGFLAVILPVLTLAVTAGSSVAQSVDPSELRPPNPGTIKGPVAALVYILIAILVGLLVFAATMPSKRGHQD